jgi:hypothetical protein
MTQPVVVGKFGGVDLRNALRRVPAESALVEVATGQSEPFASCRPKGQAPGDPSRASAFRSQYPRLRPKPCGEVRCPDSEQHKLST